MDRPVKKGETGKAKPQVKGKRFKVEGKRSGDDAVCAS